MNRARSYAVLLQNGIGFYSGFAVTANGTIYWPNEDGNGIYEFAPGSSGPTNVFDGRGLDAAADSW